MHTLGTSAYHRATSYDAGCARTVRGNAESTHMLLPDRFVAEALGLSRSALRTRRARGRLSRRGFASRATASLGDRAHALVSTVEAQAPAKVTYVIKCGIGLVAIAGGRGKLRRVTLAERAAYALETTGREDLCPCETCLRERRAWAETAAVSARATHDEDELGSRRERVL
jgi:hypothetical protein